MGKLIDRIVWLVLAFAAVGFVATVAAALVLAFSSVGYAGDRSDYINSLDPEDYCGVVADQYYAGVLGKLYGSVRELKATTAEILENLEHGIPLPKDALYVHNWDQLDDAEKAFVRSHVLKGYDKATPDLTDEAAQALGQDYFDGCLEARKSQKRTDVFPRFIKVEALENVAPAKRFSQCKEWLTDYNVIGIAVRSGRDCDQMKEWNQTTEGVEEGRRAKITRIVNEACAVGKDGVDAWFEEYSKKCMGL